MPGGRTRKQFLRAVPAALIALFGARSARGLSLAGRSPRHPDPRPGVDGSKVLDADRLTNRSAAPVYDMIREIPEVADGIFCHCGCAELDGYYSLLTCYEEGGMAQFCEICQGEARLVYGRHREGQTLDQIRRAVDARFG